MNMMVADDSASQVSDKMKEILYANLQKELMLIVKM